MAHGCGECIGQHSGPVIKDCDVWLLKGREADINAGAEAEMLLSTTSATAPSKEYPIIPKDASRSEVAGGRQILEESPSSAEIGPWFSMAESYPRPEGRKIPESGRLPQVALAALAYNVSSLYTASPICFARNGGTALPT
jgi:hypothetical protein